MPDSTFPSACSLASLFENRVAAAPSAPALKWAGETISYADLNAQANRLAAWLRENGIGSNVLVGLYFDRSFSLLVGMLAILKAGGAYLPLDLACPADRLLFQVQDAEVPLILTERARAGLLKEFDGQIACLDEMEETLAAYSAENLPLRATPDDLAYVIYTSGSTGAPKGVAVTQENVRRLFTTTNELFHFGPSDVWTLFHSSAFDFSVWEIFGALLYGGRLVIVPYAVSRSAVDFRDLLVREKVTVLNQTPSAFRQLVQADRDFAPMLKALRYVIFGGEALEFETLRSWFDRYGDEQPRCVNMYGITETTVHVTHHVVTRADIDRRGSNIGRPIPDLRVYLADDQGSLVLKGEPGEMIVGGPGVALGYLRRPELTAERFIDDRYGNSGTKLYRSGDLAREREDGNLEYLGRIDQQVKIRGFRVELGEIEAVLLRHEGVESCAVIARPEPEAESRLAAYYVARGQGPTAAELRDHLAARLPDYMVPAFFVDVPNLPLTLNGKLDRVALPDPTATRPALVSDFAAPEAEMEKLVARAWRSVLRQESVGVNDNFFDLGGDSLLLTALHRHLQAELGREFSITDLFQYPTIRAFAVHLADKAVDPFSKQNEGRAQKQRAAFQRARNAVTLRTAP